MMTKQLKSSGQSSQHDVPRRFEGQQAERFSLILPITANIHRRFACWMISLVEENIKKLLDFSCFESCISPTICFISATILSKSTTHRLKFID